MMSAIPLGAKVICSFSLKRSSWDDEVTMHSTRARYMLSLKDMAIAYKIQVTRYKISDTVLRSRFDILQSRLEGLLRCQF